jgi:hypothetical protein
LRRRPRMLGRGGPPGGGQLIHYGDPGSHSRDNTFHISLKSRPARSSTFQHSGDRHEMCHLFVGCCLYVVRQCGRLHLLPRGEQSCDGSPGSRCS